MALLDFFSRVPCAYGWDAKGRDKTSISDGWESQEEKNTQNIHFYLSFVELVTNASCDVGFWGQQAKAILWEPTLCTAHDNGVQECYI